MKLRLMITFTLLLAFNSAVAADCIRDSSGEVYCGGGACLIDSAGTAWCARSYEGGIQKLRNGEVVCGKGRCVKDSQGSVFCSTQSGGDALRDRTGQVRCYMQCERASNEYCEHTEAAIAIE